MSDKENDKLRTENALLRKENAKLCQCVNEMQKLLARNQERMEALRKEALKKNCELVADMRSAADLLNNALRKLDGQPVGRPWLRVPSEHEEAPTPEQVKDWLKGS